MKMCSFDVRNWRDWASYALSVLIAYVICSAFGTPDPSVQFADNTLLTISMITREALRILENNIVLARNINREYDDKFAVEGAKIGTTLNIRKPPKYIGRTGQALQVEDAQEDSVPLRLDTQIGVDIQFSSADLTLSIDDFADRFLKPAVANIANRIDVAVAGLYNQIYNVVGTPGTIPVLLLTYLLAGVDMDNNAAPQDEQRAMVITPLMQAYIVDALKGLFNQTTEIGEQYAKGRMGTAAGFNWSMSQNLPTHTVGTSGWTATTTFLNLGDNFTIAGVYSINPQSRASTGQLQKFVVTDTSVTDGAGLSTLAISPPIIIAGANQTVSNSPANNAAITVIGASGTVTPQGIAFHRDAMTMASADLPLPRGVDMAARVSDDQVGLSIRMVRAYDINTDNFPCRLDVLFGVAMLRPELAVRVAA
jgi:hypothetical protein